MEKTWDEINFEDYLPTGKQMLEAALMAELIDQDSYDDFIERRGNEMTNTVNHPKHYAFGGIETIDYLKAKMTAN